ncbi:MAG: 1-(5-phosphoribosyl)-5-[(5-phosphoribosylamino)methylideneamino] imidazole-4-carboxamide isomerase [Tatlockia sp.]|nr:1-(5-phosphoribosyl)-5-[(5-phosphoribosylamino)methylideneamino] imidazole-4-carboxamide isomerase [Tatlockia sp.]
MLIRPAIDLQKGQCVRLRRGQFDKLTVYDFSPLELAKTYAKAGAKHLHLVDLDGAKSGEIQQLELIETLRQTSLSLQVGGGIRSLETAKLCKQAGINTLVIGSIAVTNPKLTEQIIKHCEPENIVLAFDVHIVNGIPNTAIHGWQTTTSSSLWDLVSHYQKKGVSQILCTDIACDGMMSGPNFKLYDEALSRFPQINWQASGGIRDANDLDKLSTLGLASAILGRMLYESDFNLSSYLAGQASW